MQQLRNPTLAGIALAMAAALPPTIAAIQDPTRRALALLAGLGLVYAIGVATKPRGPWIPRTTQRSNHDLNGRQPPPDSSHD